MNGNPILSNLIWRPFAGPIGWTFANGETVARGHDLNGRVTSVSMGNHFPPSGTRSYGYDAMNRLTSFSGIGSPITYAYDATGNRTAQSGGSSGVSYAIEPTSNRIQSLTAAAGTLDFDYDATGSLAQDVSNTYTYDVAGRLASVSPGAGPSVTLAYDGQGRRIQKTTASGITRFAYDEDGHLIGEYDASGAYLQETVWLDDLPVAVLKPASGTTTAALYFVHADHLNTPRTIDDAQGQPVWAWYTITFGASLPDEDPRGTGTPFVYNLRHPGQYFDKETGLFQNCHRDYDPETGRYIESDPIGLEGGINTYGYALQNPISFIDPMGLKTTVSVRCGTLPASMGGSSGGVHCEVVAVCDKTGESTAFGIGGGGDGVWERLFGGKTPKKYENPVPLKPPAGIDQYSAICGAEGECSCDIMDCLKRGQAGNTPPPYYALKQNSNTYAHSLLNQCACSLKSRPSGAVAW